MKKNIEALYIPIVVILFHIIYLVGSIVLNYSFVGFYYAIFLRTWTDPVIALSILFIGISLAFFLKNYFFSVLGIFISSVTLSVLLQLLTRTYSFNGYLLQYITIIRFFSIFTGFSIILLLCNISSVRLLCNFSSVKKFFIFNFGINNKTKIKENVQKHKKFQNIIGLVIGLIIFFIIFLWGGYDTSRFYYPNGSIMYVIATNASNSIFNTSSWEDKFWLISAFIYFYFNWKYRSCIGHYAIKLSLVFYKKI
jgi:hypothetical protein